MSKLLNLILIICLIFWGYGISPGQTIKQPQINFSPPGYICYRTNIPLVIDGNLNETVWAKAEWTDNFVDIRGHSKTEPRFQTRVKMLWDEKYLYIAAEIEETDIWGAIQNHDDTIFYDNAFEVFIDPDGDTHNYLEIEMNALNTTWDLLLIKPYRDIRNASINNYEIKGLKNATRFDGTLNNPNDKDKKWTIEIAIPWDSFKDISETAVPPRNEDQWRINFLRVEWHTEIENGIYIKQMDKETGKRLSPDFWVWAPQGIVNMHYPEMWGYIQFSSEIVGNKKFEFIFKNEELAKWYLRQVYYSEKNYFNKFKKYTSDLQQLDVHLDPISGFLFPPEIKAISNAFEASLQTCDDKYKIIIREDGLIKKSHIKGH